MYYYVNLFSLYPVIFCCKLLYFEKWNAEINQTETEIYASERLKILVTPAYIYSQCSSLFLFLLMVWRYNRPYTEETLILRKSMYMRVSGEREFRKLSHFHFLKLLIFTNICCWYFFEEIGQRIKELWKFEISQFVPECFAKNRYEKCHSLTTLHIFVTFCSNKAERSLKVRFPQRPLRDCFESV